MKFGIQMWESLYTQFLEALGIQWELIQGAAVHLRTVG